MMSKMNANVPEFLRRVLTLRRPHGSVEEEAARGIVLQEVGTEVPRSIDRHGNLIIKVGDDCGLVFTAHLDTVHRTNGFNQLLLIDKSQMLVADNPVTGKPTVLGADDAAGMYILVEMIKAGKPGTYMFFVGEECGGIGSSAFVQDNPGFSANMCVSFDRRGYSDVITHQGGFQTCSLRYAHALSAALNAGMPSRNKAYRPSDAGLYTDSKEFAELVPECTNISVGYFNEHTEQEELDLRHLLALRDAVLAIDWAALPIDRVPEVEDGYLQSFWMRGTSAWDSPADADYSVQFARANSLLDKYYDVLPTEVSDYLRELEELA